MYSARLSFPICVVVIVAFLAPAAHSEDSRPSGELWTVTGGVMRLDLNSALLAEQGIRVEDGTDGGALGGHDGPIEFGVFPGSNLSYRWQDGWVSAMPGGETTLQGRLSLITGAGDLMLLNPVIQSTSGRTTAPLLVSDSTHGQDVVVLEFRDLRIGFDRVSQTMQVEGGQVSLSDGAARALGEPKLQDLPLGSLVMELSVEWSGGDRPLVADPEAGAGGRTTCGNLGADVIVGDLTGPSNYTNVGDIDAFAIGTDSCNIGDQNLLWVSSTNQHPVIAQNLFRLKDGRFEQVGMSWLKHGFTALTQNICGCGCNGVGGSQLGVGCSDPYSSGLNGSQSYLGPRFEVNASTGYFPYPFSFQGSGDSVYKRLQVQVDDLNPTLNAGALYFAEGQYVSPDDAAAGNQNNNASYRPASVSGSGNNYSLSLTGSTVRERPAIRAWKDTDPTVDEVDVQVPNDGLFILSGQATDIGGGFYRYEYAVQNLNSHRSMGTFLVPIPPNATVQNIGFHDVFYHSGEPFSGADWSGGVSGNSLKWATEPYVTNQDANALRWGTLYNFRFDADVTPAQIDVTLALFRPGTPATVGATIIGPFGPPPVCGDGSVTGGEECDPPDGTHCDVDCTWICGDGVTQSGEECDPPDGTTCDANCEIIYICGDGVVDPGEDCDPPNGTTCDNDCLRIPTCGDDIVDPGEECDPPDGTTCDASCQNIINDDCADAFVVCPGTYTGTTNGMTNDGSASCDSSTTSPDVWYSYTPGSNGTLNVETCGSGFDTALTIHSACPGTSGNQLVCGTDECGTQSQVSLSVSAGITYVIRVSGYNGNTGSYTLTISGPSCDPVGAVCGNGILEENEECDPPDGVTCDENCQQIGCVLILLDDDFETDLGWTPANSGATSGDWQRGVPVDDSGWAYDPAADSDGSGQCYLTENAVGNTDVDNGSVGLTSPTLDMSLGGARIAYDYYLNLTNSDGTDMLLVEIDGNDGAGPWTEIARHDTNGALTWRSNAVLQNDLDAAGVTLTSTMRIRFTVNDGTPQSIVEGGLDAVKVTVQCPDCNNNGIDDADDVASGTSTDYNENAEPDECEALGNPVAGGRLYDSWFGVTGDAPPATDHPLWQYRPDQTSNTRAGADTWRCKECHGWDYKGVDGQYGAGSHRTGFPGVLGTALTESEMFTLLREPPNNGGGAGVLNGHDYGSVLSDKKITDAVAFLLVGMIDDNTFIDGAGAFLGDPVQGEMQYTIGGGISCIVCHGADGTNLNFGTPESPEWVGTVATNNPWEFIHKVRFAQPGTPMPSWIQGGGENQGAADIGSYVQANFPVDCTVAAHCDDGDVCNGAEVCVSGFCQTGPVECGVGCDDCDGNNMPDECEPDGDLDGVIDACDNCAAEPALVDPSEPGAEVTCGDLIDNDCDGQTDDADADCVLPGCPWTCGDVDGSGGPVDLSDFLTFAGCLGTAPGLSQACTCSDMDGDNLVGLSDFLLFSGIFGAETTLTTPNCE